MTLARTAGPTVWANGSTGQSSYSISSALTCTSGNSAFIGFCVCIDPSTVISSVTLGGVAMTIVKNERVTTGGSTGTHAVLCKLTGHSLSGAKTLVVSMSGGNMYGISGVSFEYSGATAPVEDISNSANSTGTTQQIVLTGVAANAAIISVLATQFCVNEAVANGASYTLADIVNENILHLAEYTDNAGAAGNKTVDYIGCDLLFGIAAMSITDGTGPVAGPPVLYRRGPTFVNDELILI